MILPLFPVNAQTEQGNITFQPDIINQVSFSIVNRAFTISYGSYYMAFRPYFQWNGSIYTVQQALTFLQNQYPNARYTQIMERVGRTIHWGFNYTNLPPAIQNNLQAIYFKLEDHNFPLTVIELEEYLGAEDGKNYTRIHIPKANLSFDFGDIISQDFTVKVNASGIAIYNVAGKTNLYLDPVTYSSNTITVTGYTAGLPCGFANLWNADKAGTLVLDTRTGVSAVNNTAGPFSTNLRPADYVLLGGAAQDLWVNTTAFIGLTSADVTICGTDSNNAPQQETLTVAGNSTYYATKYFKTLTSSNVTAFTGTGSFSYSVTQGQWGVAWKEPLLDVNYAYTDEVFRFDCKIVLGDGATSTFLADSNKCISFSRLASTADNENIILVTNAATLTLGVLNNEADHDTKNGCLILIGFGRGYCRFPYVQNGGVANIYSCLYVTPVTYHHVVRADDGGSIRLWNSIFSGCGVGQCYDIDVYNCQFQTVNHATYGGLSNIKGSPTITGLTVSNSASVLTYWTENEGYTITNAVSINNTKVVHIEKGSQTGGDVYLVNPVVDTWAFDFAAAATAAQVYRQYTVDLTVQDSTGAAIEDAVCILTDTASTEIFNESTDATGVITQQTVTRGYYQQSTGDTLQDSSPHTLTVTKAGYQTYTQKFTLSEKTDWTITLEDTTTANNAALIWSLLFGALAFALFLAWWVRH